MIKQGLLAFQNLFYYHRIVHLPILSSIEQCYLFRFGFIAQLVQLLFVVLKFFFVPFLKFIKSIWVMIKPFSEFCGGCKVFQPFIKVSIFFFNSSGPKTIDKNSITIIFGFFFIDLLVFIDFIK